MTAKPPARRASRGQVLGRIGEDRAATYLQAHGYAILGRNIRTRLGEIDLVARRGRTVVIVEVKTRSGTRAGTPLEAITPAKAARLRRLADAFMTDHNLYDTMDVRIDCIGILREGNLERIEHVQDAV